MTKVWVKLEAKVLKGNSEYSRLIIQDDWNGQYDQTFVVENFKIHEIPESVELPKFVADMIKRGNERNEKLSETFRKIYSPGFWGASPYEKAAKWARKNPYEFTCAWVDGYVVKKEPKWRIKNNEGHYLYTFHIGTQPTYMFQKKVSAGYIFDSKEKAEAINVFVGGEVEEVESE